MKAFRNFTFRILAALLFLSGPQAAPAQDARSIVAAIEYRQAALKSVSYTLQRTDTLVTGDVRKMSGKAVIEPIKDRHAIGFRFWAQRDGFDQQTIFDGRLAYVTDTLKKTYKLISNPTDNIFYSTTGGQMIVPDLIAIDTATATRISASEDQLHYYLTIHYPDLTEHDVTQRYKTLTISKKHLLPVLVRKHQETLGKVQDLQFQILDLEPDTPAYDFSDPAFLKNYTQETPPLKAENPLAELVGKPVEDITLPTFENGKTHSLAPKGQVVLLDFWEAWCGPCIASMPKVQQLFDRYGGSGLQVYGIIHETSQLDVSRKRVAKAGLTFPMLVGNDVSKKNFHVSAIPLYVLIGKDGKVRYLHEGFSGDLEKEIREALTQ